MCGNCSSIIRRCAAPIGPQPAQATRSETGLGQMFGSHRGLLAAVRWALT